MKFHELLSQFTDEKVLKQLFILYPDQVKNIKGYKFCLKELRKLEPSISDDEIWLEINIDEHDNKFVDVFGKTYEGKDEHFGLDFNLREKWLGDFIAEETLKKFKLIEILAHCLYEMTFWGFTNAKIKKQIKMLGLRNEN
jgi:hypothetical protein